MNKRGVDQESAEYIQASWRPTTTKQYSSHVKKWFEFCVAMQWQPDRFTVNIILRFLTYLKNTKGLSVKSVMAARSAITNYALNLDDDNAAVMSNSLISKLIKGMQNLHPPPGSGDRRAVLR